ncbi:type II toxin-antitoxin system YoeB family toxin [Streptomyces koyangensis]|uniref:type II toxin-antitoxin system YoeB family toxin n=2 Tax=Streptomyces koyangensis TaxID=188770 RepID=UPI003C2F50AD
MRLALEDQGREDYISWLKNDRKMLARVNKLIEDVKRDSYTHDGGVGQDLGEARRPRWPLAHR